MTGSIGGVLKFIGAQSAAEPEPELQPQQRLDGRLNCAPSQTMAPPVLTPEEVLFFKEEGVRPEHLCCAVLLAIAPVLIIAAVCST